MYLLLFASATIVITGVAIVMLVRGLRATTRASSGAYAVFCLLLAVMQGGLTIACRAAGLAAAFAGVASPDASEKTRLLVEHIGNVAEIGLSGVMASLPPVIYAAVLFVRGRRLPVLRSG